MGSSRIKRAARFGVALLCSLNLIACTSLQPIALDRASQLLERGDKVELRTTAGATLAFKIDTIDGDGIAGGGHQLTWNQVASLSKSELDGTKTTLLVLGIIALAAAAAGGGGGGGGSGGGGGGY